MKHIINKQLFEEGISGTIPNNTNKVYKVVYWYVGQYMLILRRVRGGELNWITYSKINKLSNVYHALHKLKPDQYNMYSKRSESGFALCPETYEELSINELCKDIISKEEFEKIYEKLLEKQT